MQGAEDRKVIGIKRVYKTKLNTDGSVNNGAQFKSLIDCLMHLTATRPNILNVVSVLSRFIHYDSELHVKAS